MGHSLLIALRPVKCEASGLALLRPQAESGANLVPQAQRRRLGPQSERCSQLSG
jgi:hypothetical protein